MFSTLYSHGSVFPPTRCSLDILLPRSTVCSLSLSNRPTVVPALGDPRRERPPAMYGHAINVPTQCNVHIRPSDERPPAMYGHFCLVRWCPFMTGTTVHSKLAICRLHIITVPVCHSLSMPYSSSRKFTFIIFRHLTFEFSATICRYMLHASCSYDKRSIRTTFYIHRATRRCANVR